MFLKIIRKYNESTNEVNLVYKLCESYRKNNRVLHRCIIYLGRLTELEKDEQKYLLASRLEDMITNQGNTLPTSVILDSKVEKLAQFYYSEIKKKKKIDLKNGEDWETVNVKTIENKDAREIGAEWMCMQSLNQLGICEFLRNLKWSEEKISLAATHIISRAVNPASELKTVSQIKENSAICEITGFDEEKITKDLLYSISHKLYSVKTPLERHLSKRTNELFDLDDKIILYDLTNTYFEGQMRNSKKAKFGRSKEKRYDAKIIVLAVVVNREGFLKYSNIYEGNMADCKTLEDMLEHISSQTSETERKPIVVIDAGIATEDNIEMLKSKSYDYMCVSRVNLKNYFADIESKPITIKDKKNQPIELLKVKVENDNDRYLWVRSQAKAKKEQSISGLLSQRFEEGIKQINYGVSSKSGVKKLEKVWERIGRLKQKYPSIHKHYEIKVIDDVKGNVTSVLCKQQVKENTDKTDGVYFLRTSLNENDEHNLWTIYNTIREIECTFRVLKTDLDLRPIYHKTDDASMAHLHLGILAYWLVATIRYQLKQKGINSEWREIVRIMNTQKCVTTSVDNIRNERISIRKCTEPNQKVKQIYDILKYKYAPFTRKKSVVPLPKFANDNPSDFQDVSPP